MNKIRLRTHFSSNKVEHQLRRLMDCLAQSAKVINYQIRKSIQGTADTMNIYNEQQQKLDIISDKIISEDLEEETSFGVCDIASEEQGEIVKLRQDSGRYSVTVDPLDGSSLIDVNLAIGSIFGIHEGPLDNLRSGRDNLVAAMYVLYGPATYLVYTTKEQGTVHKFILDPRTGAWLLAEENIKVKDKGKIYAPGGLRSEWLGGHIAFIDELEKGGHKLRYSGALVADFNQILMKGGGLFSYPALRGKENGKLRLMFELQPLALIMENAGGLATNGTENILDLKPVVDQRAPIYIGSKYEVEMAKNYLKK
jgi:fructose-1,6-bisphosphatase I